MNAQAPQLSLTVPSRAAHGTAVAGAAGAGLLLGVLGGNPELGLAAVLVVVGGIVAIARQDLVSAFVVFVVYSNAAVVAVNSQGMPGIVVVAVVLLLAIPLAQQFRSGTPLVVDELLFLLLGLLLATGVSALLARDTALGMDKFQTLAIEGVLIYFLVVNVLRSPAALRLVLWSVIGAGVFLAMVTIVQYLTKTFDRPWLGFAALDPAYLSGKTTEPRAGGPVADPNYYAQLLLPALGFALVAALRGRRTALRLAAAASAATIVFALVLTSSRGGALALVAMLALLVALRTVRPLQLVALITAVCLALVLSPSYVERLQTTTTSGITAQSGTTVAADSAQRARLTENLAAWNVFADHPVFGVGPGSFPLYYQEYAARIGIEIHQRVRSGQDAGKPPEREAHNIVLGLAADLGVVGLGLFLLIVGVAFAGLLRARRSWLRAGRPDLADIASALVVGLAAYLAAGAFLSLAFERYLWLLLAIAGATIGLARRMAADAPR